MGKDINGIEKCGDDNINSSHSNCVQDLESFNSTWEPKFIFKQSSRLAKKHNVMEDLKRRYPVSAAWGF